MQMNENELLYAMALTRIPTIGNTWALTLYQAAGSATTLFENHKDVKCLIPEISDKMQEILLDYPLYVEQVKSELEFMERYQIRGMVFGSEEYPVRLRECTDAPLVLFFKGVQGFDLNRRRVISIVGTRRCTEYGKDLCHSFLKDLSNLDPNILVVSGLAYGIDAHAHENALINKMDTVGVLAHGLDRIYPQSNRGLASRVVEQGGLLTEYFSGTDPDAFNFVQRNRIVAGMSDCCIVVESDEKGGSLITADLAQGYHRDVFAFPGRVTDRFSRGCNNLIEQNVAAMLTSADAFMKLMRWDAEIPKVVQTEMFPELTPDEEKIVEALRDTEGLQINVLSVQCNLPVYKLTSALLNLEMKGIVRSLVGGTYRLL
jgi:DNA processing protein